MRDGRLQAPGRDVVLGSAGDRRRSQPAERAAAAAAGTGDGDHRADGRRRERRQRVPSLRARSGRLHRLGRARRDRGDRGAQRARTAARCERAERRRRRGRVPALLPRRREGALREGLCGLLGRPGRRLRALPPPRRDPVRLARPGAAGADGAGALAPRDGLGRRPRPAEPARANFGRARAPGAALGTATVRRRAARPAEPRGWPAQDCRRRSRAAARPSSRRRRRR